MLSSPLLKAADKVVRLGTTRTQIFFMVGRKINKGMCRFVKTASIKEAISTLLSIKGERCKVEDLRVIREGETPGSVKIFTDKGEKYIPSAEASAFFSRYNQLATSGCAGECQCDDMWKHFCVHRIAEHLASVKEKVATVIRVAKDIHTEWRDFPEQLGRLTEVQFAARQHGLLGIKAIPNPFCVEIATKENVLLGQIMCDDNGWLVKLGDRLTSVVSVLEGLVILKDPSQLDFDF